MNNNPSINQRFIGAYIRIVHDSNKAIMARSGVNNPPLKQR